jgi:hypothetical protein
MTAQDKKPTLKKLQRNRIYTICGYAIIASILAVVVCKIFGWSHVVGLGTVFLFETTSLIAFGVAWLTKGQTFLKDSEPSAKSETSDDLSFAFGASTLG